MDKNADEQVLWNLITNPIQITHKYLKAIKEELIPILNQLKKHNEFQLVDTTKKISLELSFEMPFKRNKKESKPILINGNVLNITTVNAKTLQEFLSNQVLHITDRIKAGDLSWYIEEQIYNKLLFPPITEKVERGFFEKVYRKEELKYLNILTPNINPSEFLKRGKTKINFTFKYANFISNAHKLRKPENLAKIWTYGKNYKEKEKMDAMLHIGDRFEDDIKDIKHIMLIPVAFLVENFSKAFTSWLSKDSIKKTAELNLAWTLNVDYENNNIQHSTNKKR